jgi:hypothetical protein
MYTLLLLALVIFHNVLLGAYGLPELSAISHLFADSSIPLLSDADLAKGIIDTRPPNSHSTRIDKRALPPLHVPYLKYAVTMDGRNVGNHENFLISGSLLVTTGILVPPTQNDPNPYDIVFSVGSPFTKPVAGSIRYVTNKYLDKVIGDNAAATGLDFAYVTYTGNTVNVTIDSRVAAANVGSGFNAKSGHLADVYRPANGGFQLTVGANKQLSGEINIRGTSTSNSTLTRVPYVAKISGSVVGHGILIL